jgi:hypothetical protein
VVQGGLKQQAQERPLTTLLAAQGPVKASELVRFLKGVGVAVPFKQKESRSRLLGRADAQLAKMDSPRRQAVLRTTRKELGIDETRGWVEVIRGDQPGK